MAIPKQIHCFWHESIYQKQKGTTPRFVQYLLQCCVNRMKTLHKDYIVTVYTLDIVRTFPDYPSQILKPYEDARDYAHIADWLRLYLLYNKGGIWMDISSIVLHRVDNVCDMNNHKMQMYTAAWSQHIPESWFIVSPPRLLLTKKWLEEFTLALSQSLPVYVTSNKQYVVDDLRDRIPYLTLNVCFWKARQTVLKSHLQYTILASADAPGSPLHIQYAYFYNSKPGKALPNDVYSRFWKGITKEQRKKQVENTRMHQNTVQYLCKTRHIPMSITRSFIKLTKATRYTLLYSTKNFTTYRNHAFAHIFIALKFNYAACLQFKHLGFLKRPRANKDYVRTRRRRTRVRTKSLLHIHNVRTKKR